MKGKIAYLQGSCQPANDAVGTQRADPRTSAPRILNAISVTFVFISGGCFE